MKQLSAYKREILKEAVACLDNNDIDVAYALIKVVATNTSVDDDEEEKDFDYYLNPPDGKPYIGKRIDSDTGKEIWCLLKRNTKYKHGPNEGKTQCAKKFTHKPSVKEIVDALRAIQYFINN